MITNVTLGADPELFLIDTETNKIISSIGLIPGKKGHPWKKRSWPKGFGLEIDNILAEYNIPPCTSKEEWIASHNFMKEEIRKFVKSKKESYDILASGSEIADPDILDNEIACLFG